MDCWVYLFQKTFLWGSMEVGMLLERGVPRQWLSLEPLVSIWLLAARRLRRCLRWAQVFQRILKRELVLCRFQRFIEMESNNILIGLSWTVISQLEMSEQNQKIQKYIIKSSPYGQLNEVIKDLEKLAPLDLSSPAYHEEHLGLFAIHPSVYFPVSAISRVDTGKYLDQMAKKVYTVDYLKGEVISAEDYNPELIESVEELLQHLSTAADKYTSTYYREPCASSVFMSLSEEALDVHVAITSKNIQLGNFVTGEWVSKWVVRKGQIEGTISIRAHFFESGNVQFNQRKNIKKEFTFTEDMAENAKNIIKVIENAEGEVQSNLNDLYEEMPTGFFKHLRRVVPFTKTKMAWNINAIKMNRNLLGINK